MSPTARSTAQCCVSLFTNLLLLVMLCHVSNVQGFATYPGRSSISSPASKKSYVYSSLQSQRFNLNPLGRRHQRTKSTLSDFPMANFNPGSTRIPQFRARVSSMFSLQRPNITIEKTVSRPKNTQSTRRYRKFWLAFASMAIGLLVRPTLALAMGAMGGASKGPVGPVSKKDVLSLFGVFFGLFVGLALLHAAEIAITTLYPWKVREFAEEVSIV